MCVMNPECSPIVLVEKSTTLGAIEKTYVNCRKPDYESPQERLRASG